MSPMQIDALSELIFYIFVLIVAAGAWVIGCFYGYRRCVQDTLNAGSLRARKHVQSHRRSHQRMHIEYRNPLIDITSMRPSPLVNKNRYISHR